LRQQTGKGGGPQLAPLTVGACIALRDVAADQLARLFGQLTIPAGQQCVERRTSPPPGGRDEQRAESFLQVTKRV
jgi:hypothetical protein